MEIGWQISEEMELGGTTIQEGRVYEMESSVSPIFSPVKPHVSSLFFSGVPEKDTDN